jgi:hypothetical protein
MLLIRLSIISIFQRKRNEEEEEERHIRCSAGVARPLKDLKLTEHNKGTQQRNTTKEL